MLTLEFGSVSIEAPDCLTGLRDEVGEIAASSDPTVIAEAQGSGVVQEYSHLTGQIWGEAAVTKTIDQFGDNVANIGRAGLLWCCGELILSAAYVEASELVQRVESIPSHDLPIRTRVARKIRSLLSIKPQPDIGIEGDALTIFHEELGKEALGTINSAEDLRPIVERTAHTFIAKTIGLDEYEMGVN